MRDVAVVSFAQSKHVRRLPELNEVEMLMPVLGEVRDKIGITQDRIGFTCSGSSDYLAGQAFSFVMTLDGVGAWPPIVESHVEMDGAWALYEAWVKLQIGEVDTALVYSYSKSSPGTLRDVLTRQLDPYYVAPLWPDAVSLAALQARAVLDAGLAGERDFAEVARRNRADASANPFAQLKGARGVDDLMRDPYIVSPLRRHACPPISDGAAAMVLAAGDAAKSLCKRPAWIRGIDHRIETHAFGARNLAESPSTAIAAARAGVARDKIDVAELHAPFAPQELILARTLKLADSVKVNPSGGPLAANPMMAAGLIRIGEAAERIHQGKADRALAHATSGHCLQQNLVCVLEGD
jgi:acetyl-CoA acetyltransferase